MRNVGFVSQLDALGASALTYLLKHLRVTETTVVPGHTVAVEWHIFPPQSLYWFTKIINPIVDSDHRVDVYKRCTAVWMQESVLPGNAANVACLILVHQRRNLDDADRRKREPVYVGML